MGKEHPILAISYDEMVDALTKLTGSFDDIAFRKMIHKLAKPLIKAKESLERYDIKLIEEVTEKVDLDALVDDVSVCGVCGSVNQCQYCGHCSKCSHIKVESVEAEMKRYRDRLKREMYES
jgi:hypothetical protein